MLTRNILILFFFLFTNPSISLSQELQPEKIFEQVEKSVVVIYSYDNKGNKIAQGSGVVFDEAGYVVTNFHVLSGGVDIKVQHYNKSIIDISVAGFDELKDVLVLKIPQGTLPSLKIADTTKIKPGQRIYAIGSPLGLENSISEGVISGLRYSYYENVEYIQISAPVSHGSSGGAVVNSFGELVGISTFVLKDGQNLNFAIKVNDFIALTNINLSVKELQCNLLFSKGMEAYKLQKYKEAINFYTDYLKIKDDNEEVYFNRALAITKIYDYKWAINDYTQALKINPKYISALFNRASIYSHIDEYDNAVKDYSKILELNPMDADSYLFRGINYIKIKNSNLALEDLTKAISMSPQNEKAYNFRGVAYKNLSKYDEALADLNKAIDLNYEYVEAYYNRGDIYLTKKELLKCIADNTRAIELDPQFGLAYINRGIAYYQSKEVTKACSDLFKAKNLGIRLAGKYLNLYCND